MIKDFKSDAIDKGINFALKHNKNLLKLFLFPFLLQFFSAAFFYTSSLNIKVQFLLLIFILLGRAWFLTSFTFYVISVARKEDVELKKIIKNALISCPKVLLSSLALLFIFLLALDITPAFIVLFFLIWAPLFPAFEQCVSEKTEEELKQKLEDKINELREKEEENPEALVLKKSKFLEDEEPAFKPTWFANKFFFNFGFSRSLQFSSKHIKEGLLLALLFWFSSVFPEFFSSLLSYNKNFFLVLLEAAVSSILYAYTLAISVVALLSLLPVDARSELALPKKLNKEFWLVKKDKKRFFSSGNKFLVSALFLASLFSTYFLLNKIISLSEMPKEISFRSNVSAFKEENFVLEFDVHNSEGRYSWMGIGNFYLSFDKNNESLSLKNKKEQESAEPNISKLPEARRVIYLNESGEIIKLNSVKPDSSLKVRLYFSQNELSENIEKEGSYQLYFKNQKGSVSKVLKAKYPKGFLRKTKRVKSDS